LGGNEQNKDDVKVKKSEKLEYKFK